MGYNFKRFSLSSIAVWASAALFTGGFFYDLSQTYHVKQSVGLKQKMIAAWQVAAPSFLQPVTERTSTPVLDTSSSGFPQVELGLNMKPLKLPEDWPAQSTTPIKVDPRIIEDSLLPAGKSLKQEPAQAPQVHIEETPSIISSGPFLAKEVVEALPQKLRKEAVEINKNITSASPVSKAEVAKAMRLCQSAGHYLGKNKNKLTREKNKKIRKDVIESGALLAAKHEMLGTSVGRNLADDAAYFYAHEGKMKEAVILIQKSMTAAQKGGKKPTKWASEFKQNTQTSYADLWGESIQSDSSGPSRASASVSTPSLYSSLGKNVIR